MRGATALLSAATSGRKFQPTRPLRGATPVAASGDCSSEISTHAPLAGRDIRREDVQRLLQISTHAPLAGRDCSGARSTIFIERFQPTRPLRGATAVRPTVTAYTVNFNPRAPCGARPLGSREFYRLMEISTHAPLAGRDHETGVCLTAYDCYFNPRAPCGARPAKKWLDLPFGKISTHAPLAGRDSEIELTEVLHYEISNHAPLAGRDYLHLARCQQALPDFNPRAPCGARHIHPYR